MHGGSFDSGAPTICTPSSLKEESDLSSGPPSSDSGYEATPNYVTMSSTSSPRRPYFTSMYDRDENDFLECHYDTLQSAAFNNHNTFRSNSHDNRSSMHPLHTQPHHHHHQQHPQPQSPLFYSQSYSGYPFYSTGYYPNALGITPCNDNSAVTSTAPNNNNTSNAAAAAAAVALMRSPNNTSDLLSHHHQQATHQQQQQQPDRYSPTHHHQPPPTNYYHPLPENAYGADI